MCTPSATLTVWAAAWLDSRHAPDDVLAALQEWTPRHAVVAGDPVAAHELGLPEAWLPSASANGLTTLLKTLRAGLTQAGAEFRLLLPVPGDVRGLPLGTAFASDVIAVGEGVLIGPAGHDGIGLVPRWSEDESVVWTVYLAPVPVDSGMELTLGEVEHSMRAAVRDAADAMARLRGLGSVGGAEDPRAQVEAQLAAYSRHKYPESTPLRARRVLDTADHVAAILTVAQREPSCTPASATGLREQEDLFRPLWSVIRDARLVAVRAAVQGRGRAG
jgi:hypothetical protein